MTSTKEQTMNELDRRHFLARAALGGATAVGAASLGPLAPLAAADHGPSVGPL